MQRCTGLFWSVCFDVSSWYQCPHSDFDTMVTWNGAARLRVRLGRDSHLRCRCRPPSTFGIATLWFVSFVQFIGSCAFRNVAHFSTGFHLARTFGRFLSHPSLHPSILASIRLPLRVHPCQLARSTNLQNPDNTSRLEPLVVTIVLHGTALQFQSIGKATS